MLVLSVCLAIMLLLLCVFCAWCFDQQLLLMQYSEVLGIKISFSSKLETLLKVRFKVKDLLTQVFSSMLY